MGGNGMSNTPDATIDYLAVEARIAKIESDLKSMRETLDFIKETLVKADVTITKVAAEVMPTLDAVMQSPMLKMLMPKGKK
jgi:hypothetical protein